jgi:hypothetical protein
MGPTFAGACTIASSIFGVESRGNYPESQKGVKRVLTTLALVDRKKVRVVASAAFLTNRAEGRPGHDASDPFRTNVRQVLRISGDFQWAAKS